MTISPAAGSQFGRSQAELTVIRKQLPAFGGTCLSLEAAGAKSRLVMIGEVLTFGLDAGFRTPGKSGTSLMDCEQVRGRLVISLLVNSVVVSPARPSQVQS